MKRRILLTSALNSMTRSSTGLRRPEARTLPLAAMVTAAWAGTTWKAPTQPAQEADEHQGMLHTAALPLSPLYRIDSSAPVAEPSALPVHRTPMSAEFAEDAALMRRIAQGDSRAFRELSDRHLNSIVRFARRLVSNHAEAEDIAQETFLRAWQRAGEYEPRARLSTWLFAVAKNLAIDRLRKQGRRGAHVELDDERDMAPRADRPSGLLIEKAQSITVEKAIAALPERQRVAVVLWHEEGLSNPEIANVLDCSVEAVESLLARGRRTLRQLLASKAPSLPPQSTTQGSAK